MKKILVLSVIVALLVSCKGSKTTNKAFEDTKLVTVRFMPNDLDPQPSDMAYIPSGSYTMGSNDENISWSDNINKKTVTIQTFWMNQTEVTNLSYRKFVNWVRDSVVRVALGKTDEAYLIKEDADGNLIEPAVLNWKEPIDLKDPEKRKVFEDAIYYPKEQRIQGIGNMIDPTKLVYHYIWRNIAAEVTAKYDPVTGLYSGQFIDNKGKVVEIIDKTSFIMKEDVNVYPDELCWARDFVHSYNDPMVKTYFNHPMFNEYPVVGITWAQAKAYCDWKTKDVNQELSRQRLNTAMDYRLPTEAEWEYASRGGVEGTIYPWGGPYIRNGKGCFYANFKPLRGNYSEDGAAFTNTVASYTPNPFGLYDMSGNVAEWCEDAFELVNTFANDLNPVYKNNVYSDRPKVLQRKVIRGGSWKDIGFYLQNSVRTFEYQNSTKPFIGFRCVRDAAAVSKSNL